MADALLSGQFRSENIVQSWQTQDGMTLFYTNAIYMPAIGDYELLTLDTPFVWNGIDNILIDTAFGLVPAYTQSGTVRYTSVTNGYRYTRSDTDDQTPVCSGGSGGQEKSIDDKGVP